MNVIMIRFQSEAKIMLMKVRELKEFIQTRFKIDPNSPDL